MSIILLLQIWSLVTTHTTSLCVMLEVLNRASSVFLDSRVKPWNDKNVFAHGLLNKNIFLAGKIPRLKENEIYFNL